MDADICATLHYTRCLRIAVVLVAILFAAFEWRGMRGHGTVRAGTPALPATLPQTRPALPPELDLWTALNDGGLRMKHAQPPFIDVIRKHNEAVLNVLRVIDAAPDANAPRCVLVDALKFKADGSEEHQLAIGYRTEAVALDRQLRRLRAIPLSSTEWAFMQPAVRSLVTPEPAATQPAGPVHIDDAAAVFLFEGGKWQRQTWLDIPERIIGDADRKGCREFLILFAMLQESTARREALEELPDGPLNGYLALTLEIMREYEAFQREYEKAREDRKNVQRP